MQPKRMRAAVLLCLCCAAVFAADKPEPRRIELKSEQTEWRVAPLDIAGSETYVKRHYGGDRTWLPGPKHFRVDDGTVTFHLKPHHMFALPVTLRGDFLLTGRMKSDRGDLHLAMLQTPFEKRAQVTGVGGFLPADGKQHDFALSRVGKKVTLKVDGKRRKLETLGRWKGDETVRIAFVSRKGDGVARLGGLTLKRRPRATAPVPGGKVGFIRLEYRGGDWNQDMGINGDMNMLLEFHKRTGLPVAEDTEAIEIDELARLPKDKKPPFVFITGARGIDITPQEGAILRAYLLHHEGMLFADNGGGHFHQSFADMMLQVLPKHKFVKIPSDDPIFQHPYKLPHGAPSLWHHSGSDALGIKHEGRWVVFYHQGDLADAWKTGHSGTSKEAAELAYRLGVNVIAYAIHKRADDKQNQ